MVINPTKCVLGVPELEFLGHLVSKDGIQPLEDKVQVIREFPPPHTHSINCGTHELLPPLPASLHRHPSPVK